LTRRRISYTLFKKYKGENPMERAGKNKSQLEELRDPKTFFLNKYCKWGELRLFDSYPLAPLGHVRSVLLDLGIVKIKEWPQFLSHVKAELSIGGNGFAFSSNLEEDIPSRMFDNIFGVFRKYYRRRMTCFKFRRFIEEVYGHPYMTWHYMPCPYCIGYKLSKLKPS
jgi:hypothetical protein